MADAAAPDVPEDERQRAFLRMPLGERGSGAVRYAAAMYFHAKGEVSHTELEAYRICAKDDREDPMAVLVQLQKEAVNDP